MTDLREVAKLALWALEDAAYCVQNNYLPEQMGHDWDAAIIALKSALANDTSQERVDKEKE